MKSRMVQIIYQKVKVCGVCCLVSVQQCGRFVGINELDDKEKCLSLKMGQDADI